MSDIKTETAKCARGAILNFSKILTLKTRSSELIFKLQYISVFSIFSARLRRENLTIEHFIQHLLKRIGGERVT